MELKEQLAFLANLKSEMNTQDSDCQANPRFWVVMDYKNEPCWEGHADFYEVCSSEIEMFGTVNDFKEDLNDNGYLEDLNDELVEELNRITDDAELVDWMKDHLNIEAYIVPMRKVEVIKKDTFFITKRECQEHIERNQHHYSNKAHTYAMTAWRSPQVEKLWNVLETLNIDELLRKIDK